MNENFDLWLSELRSGKYKKTTGRLYGGGNCYCATGILGRLMGYEPKIINGRGYLMEPNGDYIINYSLSLRNYEVAKFLRASLTNVEFMMRIAIQMNDTGMHSFEEIADELEKRFK